MPLFQKTIAVKEEDIRAIVSQNWNLKLGKLLKASQNHTFQAFSQDQQQKFSVRVTPYTQDKHLQRITDEIFFVNYVCSRKLNHMCSPIRPLKQSSHKEFVVINNMIIVVFQWAKGSPIQFMKFRWANDKQLILAWGRFFGQLHKLSKQFTKNHPQISKRIQKWDQIHSSILAGVKLHPHDSQQILNSESFGIIHGDLNLSNVHYVEEGHYLSVYDTDQVQQSFFLFDLAQSIFTNVMLQDLGLPVSGEKVEGINSKEYQQILIQGYESEGFKVDREMLQRMVDLKKQFYLRFCTKAIQQGDIPAHMKPFIQYVVKFGQQKWKISQ